MDCRVKPGNDGGWSSADGLYYEYRHSLLLVAARARDLLLQHLPDVELEPTELRRCRQRHEVARAGERHVDDPFDAAGLGGHHDGAVAEQQRLLDRMGDV